MTLSTTSSSTLFDAGSAISNHAFLDTMVSMLTGKLQPMLEQAMQVQRAPILSFPPPAPASAVIPASVDASSLQALHEIYPNGRFLSVEQAQMVQLASHRVQHLVGVLPTGGGKSAVWEVNARRERQQGRFTVVFAPFNALLDQHKTKAEALGITTQRFTTIDTPLADLIFVSFEKTANPSFWDWLKKNCGPVSPGGLYRLVRFIIDEAHYLVDTNNQDFRPKITHMSRLSSYGVPVVCLTATLPPSHVRDLSLRLDLHQPREVRAYTGRLNIRYSARKIPKVGYMDASQEVEHACQAIWEAVSPLPQGRRIIVYFQDLKVLDAIFTSFRSKYGDVGKFHAKMTLEEATQSMEAWGSGFRTLLASKACGLGIDRPDVDHVLHWECPTSLVDYAQESGRAGRMGQAAEAVILYTRLPSVPMEDRNGRVELITTLESSVCRRQVLEAFMDGQGLNCLARPAATRLCDNCETSIAMTYPNPHPPAPLLVPSPISFPAQSVSQPPTPAQLIASSSDSPIPPPNVRRIVENLKGRCAICYLEGRGRVNGSAFGCQGHPGLGLRGAISNFKYSVDWPTTNCTFICWRCYLPMDDYHANPRDRAHRSCTYDNVLPPIMYWVWRNVEWQRAVQEWIGQKFVDVDGYTVWCRKESKGVYNVVRLTEWVDTQLEANGKWSVAAGAGAI